MSNEKFIAQVGAFVRKSEQRVRAVQAEATQRTIDIASLPTAKGGRMRVDTGFLRASGQVSLTGMPTGPVRPAKDAGSNEIGTGQKYEQDTGVISLALARAPAGSKVWFGWTANYARAREFKDGFMRLAVQRWPKTVAEVITELKRRIK